MILLEYQAMPSLRDGAHDGVLCTFSNRSDLDRDKWCDPSVRVAWTVHHVQNPNLLGHTIQLGGPLCLASPLSSLRPHWGCGSGSGKPVLEFQNNLRGLGTE